MRAVEFGESTPLPEPVLADGAGLLDDLLYVLQECTDRLAEQL